MTELQKQQAELWKLAQNNPGLYDFLIFGLCRLSKGIPLTDADINYAKEVIRCNREKTASNKPF